MSAPIGDQLRVSPDHCDGFFSSACKYSGRVRAGAQPDGCVKDADDTDHTGWGFWAFAEGEHHPGDRAIMGVVRGVKAPSKDGKPLAGAAKTTFIKKCEADAKVAAPTACADKAIDKNGKPLAGAAKDAFMKKCESGK